MELIKRSFPRLPVGVGVFTRWALRIGLQAPRERRSRRLFPPPFHAIPPFHSANLSLSLSFQPRTPAFPCPPFVLRRRAALPGIGISRGSRDYRRISANTANEYLEILSPGRWLAKGSGLRRLASSRVASHSVGDFKRGRLCGTGSCRNGPLWLL